VVSYIYFTEHYSLHRRLFAIVPPREKCGIFSVYNHKDSNQSFQLALSGLLSLQHRGQEGAGLAYKSESDLREIKCKGLVNRLFKETKPLPETSSLVGHVRYSTSGEGDLANVQPLISRSVDGKILALAHNGHIISGDSWKQDFLRQGHIFHSSADTEILLALLFYYQNYSLKKAVEYVIKELKGAFAAVAYDGNEMVGFRDRYGFRPLVFGQKGETLFFSSETCGLDAVNANFLGEVSPGEMVSFKGRQWERHSVLPLPENQHSFCIFEFVYFARPDSVFLNKNVYQVRKKMGAFLSAQITSPLDIIVPVPDSGISAALGLAKASGIPMERALYLNPYQGRTFIQPGQENRKKSSRLKYHAISPLLQNKKVGLVDDSLVRGTTAQTLTSLLKSAGAQEVHFFISSPPFKFPCYYGIDVPSTAQLTTDKLTSLQNIIGANSINFATLESLFEAIGHHQAKSFCSACFTGDYPA